MQTDVDQRVCDLEKRFEQLSCSVANFQQAQTQQNQAVTQQIQTVDAKIDMQQQSLNARRCLTISPISYKSRWKRSNSCSPSDPGTSDFRSLQKSKNNMHAEDGGCFWHAADTAPLEGLSILRCAIYDPVEGLQISIMRFSEMGV